MKNRQQLVTNNYLMKNFSMTQKVNDHVLFIFIRRISCLKRDVINDNKDFYTIKEREREKKF